MSSSQRLLVQEEQGQGWRSMESAPKDGTTVLLANGIHVCSGWYDATGAQWVASYGRTFPTHWMPLPSPPETASEL